MHIGKQIHIRTYIHISITLAHVMLYAVNRDEPNNEIKLPTKLCLKQRRIQENLYSSGIHLEKYII